MAIDFNFNPLPPHGGRHIFESVLCEISNFNPLPPHGGRLYNFDNVFCVELFQSTPSAWRETLPDGEYTVKLENFNPLPPHGGRQSRTAFVDVFTLEFQSTPSAWRETFTISSVWSVLRNFNPLPPHGGRLSLFSKHFTNVHISIHSLRMEGDFACPQNNLTDAIFQSTPSAWRET